jgi:Ca-activated chloride channel family protein
LALQEFRGDALLAVAPRKVLDPSSTPAFIDVRTAPLAVLPPALGRSSFDLARQCLRDFAVLPPASIIRLEEFINQFDYEEPPNSSGGDFTVTIDAAACPWNDARHLVRVSVCGREVPMAELPPARVTFLVRLAETADNERAQLLLWQGFQALLGKLRSHDSVAIVVSGQSNGVVLESTPGSKADAICQALECLPRPRKHVPETAWAVTVATARQHFAAGGINRLILVTDGPLDFDGAPPIPSVARTLTAHGIDACVAQLGPVRPAAGLAGGVGVPLRHADSSADVARLFARQWLAPTMPLAEHCAVEVSFNPAHVHSWRPLGFESPTPAPATPPAPDAWSFGQQVTAVYEIVPLGRPVSWQSGPSDQFLRETQRWVTRGTPSESESIVRVSVRYRPPLATGWQQVEAELFSSRDDWRNASPAWRLAAAAAGYGRLLKAQAGAQEITFSLIRQLADTALSADPFGLRQEFAGLVTDAEHLANSGAPYSAGAPGGRSVSR